MWGLGYVATNCRYYNLLVLTRNYKPILAGSCINLAVIRLLKKQQLSMFEIIVPTLRYDRQNV